MLIQGHSMEPSYHHLQPVLLDKQDKEYTVGDVVAFDCKELSAVLVKRIVARPGDTVVIDDGTLYRNGEASELYSPGVFSYAGLLDHNLILGSRQYAVIGDNLNESKDSRYPEVGIVEEDNIRGIVIGCNGN